MQEATALSSSLNSVHNQTVAKIAVISSGAIKK